MTEDNFWQIIESNQGDAKRIEGALSRLLPDEIKDWSDLYWQKHNALHRWDVWGAAYVINGGCSDDGFHYFKSWVIGKGRAAYEAALKSPDDLGPFVTDDDTEEGCDNEMLNYAADQAYESVAQAKLKYVSSEGSDPAGEEWDEDTVDKQFPKLAAKFWE